MPPRDAAQRKAKGDSPIPYHGYPNILYFGIYASPGVSSTTRVLIWYNEGETGTKGGLVAQLHEKQKMLAGEVYNCLDPALVAEREQAKRLLRQYNQSSDPAAQRRILRTLLGEVGDGTIIEPPFYCSYGSNLYLGSRVYLNFCCTILDNNQVRLGHDVMLGPQVQIYTAEHPLKPASRRERWESARPVLVADNVWIGGGAIILPGVTIGQNAVVGAGAVVTHDVPANTVVAGNPARIIRTIKA